MTMRFVALALGAGLMLGTCANAQESKGGSPGRGSEMFVHKAATAGMFEIQSSEIVKDRLQNAALRRFAERMIKDHTKANHELQQLVSSGKVEGVSALPNKLDAQQSAEIDQLHSAAASRVDRLYRDMQLTAHEEAVLLFRNEATTGDDPDLKSWAGQTLPVLEEHLSMIRSIQEPQTAMRPSASSSTLSRAGNAALADEREQVRVATNIIQQMKKDREIDKLLQRAKGVFVLPDFGRVALGVGVRGGEGVLMVKQDDRWSGPAFYNAGAFSVGAQAGVSGGSVAFLLMNDQAIRGFKSTNNFALNADAGLSIINYSANAQGAYGKGDVVVWSDTEGLFAGVALSISDIVWDEDENRAYYGANVTPGSVLAGKQEQHAEAQALTSALTQ